MNRALFLVLIVSSVIISTLDLYGGGPKEPYKERVERIRFENEYETLKKLGFIENKLENSTNENIKELDGLIRYSIENDLDLSLAKAYLLTGQAYKIIGQPQLAIYFLERAEEVYKKPKEKLDLKRFEFRKIDKGTYYEMQRENPPNSFFLDMAETHAMLRSYKKSNEYYLEYQQLGLDEATSLKIKYAIAANYFAAEDYNNAIILYNNILELEQTNGNQEGVIDCYSRLAACYISIDKTDEGMGYYNKSIQQKGGQSEEYESDRLANSSKIVSNALRKKGKFKEEIDVRNQSLKIADASIEHLRLAQSYFGAKDYVQCEKSLDLFFENPSSNFIDKNELEVVKLMAQRLQNEANLSKSLEYLMGYQNLLDSIEIYKTRRQSVSENMGSIGLQSIVELENLQKDKEIARVTIDHLVQKDILKEEMVNSQKTIIYLLVVFILLGIISVIYILRVSRQRRIVNQQLALRSLRSQMNPHFIFNALNSVNSFISVSDTRSANQFLSDFSKLMRAVMENSESDFIPLYKELEIIEIYLELEHFRFKNKFNYDLIIDPKLDDDACEIPPMLLQPYIENAIWHGLRYKEKDGELIVKLQAVEKALLVVIQDNGIGREESKKVKTKNQLKSKSTALRNIGERIKIFNDLHKIKIEVDIKDLHENGSGTVVTIRIPQK